uniref:Integrase core domain containing protein n=1 Tax=Solanum tuberosum TaxID=4113 RepID=M1DC13_SOLTU
MEFEALYKKKDRYIPPYVRKKSKDYEGGQIEEILSLILHKVKEHDRMLKEIKENVSMLNQMTSSHSIYIRLLETQMGRMLSCLYPRQKGELPSDTRENPMNQGWRAKSPVVEPDLDCCWTQQIIRLESIKLGGPMDNSDPRATTSETEDDALMIARSAELCFKRMHDPSRIRSSQAATLPVPD